VCSAYVPWCYKLDRLVTGAARVVPMHVRLKCDSHTMMAGKDKVSESFFVGINISHR